MMNYPMSNVIKWTLTIWLIITVIVTIIVNNEYMNRHDQILALIGVTTISIFMLLILIVAFIIYFKLK